MAQQIHTKCGWPEGVKKTKSRKSVMEVLEQAEMPMTANDIYAAILRTGEQAWLSTVYRVLEVFEAKGTVKKIMAMADGMALYELSCNNHKHYAICIGCRKIIPMENCPVENFLPKLKERGFEVVRHRLELYGYCSACADSQRKS